MKKVTAVLIFLVAVMCLSISCSQGPLKDDYDIFQSIRKHENIPGDLRKCSAITEKGKLLFIGVTGENEQTYRYSATEFSIGEDNAYYYARSIPLNRLAWQCCLCRWKDGYVVICNNAQAYAFRASIRACDMSSETVGLEINEVPWINYLKLHEDYASYEIEYSFLDQEGDEIN